MGNSKLSKWLRSNAIKQNIRSTLKSTINSLHSACPLKVSRENISKSLRDILHKDKFFREKSEIHTRIFNWFEKNPSKPSKPYAVFKKRVYSSAFFGSKAITNNYNINTNNYNTEQNRESSPPPVKQIFSFTDEEQGAIIEPLLNLVEKALNEFLINNEHMIPSINADFSNADTLNMLNFVIENIKIFDKSVFHGQHKSAPVELFKNFKNNVRNKVAHGTLIDKKGRWSDHALQNITILVCDVVTCLGGNYKGLYAIKERFDNKIIQKWTDKTTSEVENKNHENQLQPPKRRHDDSDFREMTKFVRDILKEVDETKEGSKQKIMKLALREDDDLMQIWRAVKTTECKREQSHEFIEFVNLAFNVNLKCISIEVPEVKQVDISKNYEQEDAKGCGEHPE
ncbi:hypothetical protein Glove_131g49 [Diversispora epigaea]|uniref:Uncharacterized protein n=1 Tax=Diversispora epigaea TaxID=1348612 RepID=A0A397J2B9_9GLOM|nr:hypothetical protein Glove_131g49 [Diversispora epigaea]